MLEGNAGGVAVYVESESVELKREYSKDIVKEIIAFMNTKGGTIFIGVDDDGEVVGVEDVDRVTNQLASVIHDSIRPDAKGYIHIDILESNIISVRVEEGSAKPYYLQGKGLRPEGVFVRLGAASVPSSEAGIKRMLIDSINTNFEEMPSIHQNLTFNRSRRVFEDNNMGFDENDLRNLHVLDVHDRYTNLGFLLSDQCTHSIKVAVFSEEDEFEFLDRKEFVGPVFSVLMDTLNYLELNNHLHSRVVEYKRMEKYDYNSEILREGLLNAIIHRDYAYTSSIMISVYKNRIEMTSLGGLVYGLHPRDIGTGISLSRNPGLADVFYRLKYIEAYGTGIKKIAKDYSDFDLKELVQITDNTFKLILWNKNKGASPKTFVGETRASYNTYKTEEEIVLSLLMEKGRISRMEVQEAMGIGQTKAGLLLKALLDKGIITRKGNGKNTKYTLL